MCGVHAQRINRPSLYRGKSAIDVKLLSAAQVGRVAQLAEQCPFKAWVDGSSPSALTITPHHFTPEFF
jgi:hypothetical protein